jgi:predicted transposase YdaD
VKYLERHSYTKAELNAYEKYRDVILTTRTYYVDALAEGIEKGKAEGKMEGRAEGKAEGAQQKLSELVVTGNKNGLSIEQIQAYFNLDRKQIEEILTLSNET